MTQPLPSDGREVPLRWRSAAAARRIVVRPTGGTHGWCAPFSPEALGKRTLKLRPVARAAADDDADEDADGAAEDASELYLRLAIAMHGSRRLLTLRSAESAAGLQLPHRLLNDSSLLVAFRQCGCEHWDLLGSGESCAYVWDAPEAPHALQVCPLSAPPPHPPHPPHPPPSARTRQLCAYDPAGGWHATSPASAYSLERLERCADLKLEPLAAPLRLHPFDAGLAGASGGRGFGTTPGLPAAELGVAGH